MVSRQPQSGGEIIDLLARLVAFETESGAPNAALVDFCAEHAERAGAQVLSVEGPSGRSNLHARYGPDEPGGLLLSGHTDVVPAGSGWSTDPYQLTETGGKLQGRGTADMKGFVATALAVAAATDHRRMRSPLHVALSYDEEIGCIGVRGLLDHLASQPSCQPAAVLVGEPTSMRLATAHTGKTAHRVMIRTPSGHSSRARHEPSAISEAIKLCAAINALNATESPGGADATRKSPDRPSAGNDAFVPGSIGAISSSQPARPSTPSRFVSANIGVISGGVGLNVLAPECELAFEIRFGASVDLDCLAAPIWADVQRVDAELASVGGGARAVELAAYPALHTDPALSAVRKLGSAIGAGQAIAVDFGCEAGLYAQHLGVPTVIAGPGDIADAHQPDEHIDPAQLLRCSEVLHKAVTAFCGPT